MESQPQNAEFNSSSDQVNISHSTQGRNISWVKVLRIIPEFRILRKVSLKMLN